MLAVAGLIGSAVLVSVLVHRRKQSKQEVPPKSRRVVPFQPFLEGQGHCLLSPSFFRQSPSFVQLAKDIASDVSPICRYEVVSELGSCAPPEALFWARALLTPQECAQVILAAEQTGFEERKFEGQGRDSSSCVVWCPQLAQAIFERLQRPVEGSLLPRRSYYDASPGVRLDQLDFANQDVNFWGKLVGCNPSCRVERYRPGQLLKIHRDGAVLVRGPEGGANGPNDSCALFATSEQCVGQVYTVHAVLIYLNADFQAGTTDFVCGLAPDGQYHMEGTKGSVGDALIFRHEVLHRGGRVESGVKYILRLDLGFEMETSKTIAAT
jgi:hypothetical protein